MESLRCGEAVEWGTVEWGKIKVDAGWGHVSRLDMALTAGRKDMLQKLRGLNVKAIV
jgi:hypothetical protein